MNEKNLKHRPRKSAHPPRNSGREPAVCKACRRPLRGKATWTNSKKRLDGEPLWRWCHGDGVEALLDAVPGSVSAVLTDLPYGSGFTNGERLRSSKEKYVSSTAAYKHALPDMAGDSVFAEAWRRNTEAMLGASAKALVPGGHFVSFIDWRGLPALQSAVLASGLRLRGVAVWDKGEACRPYRGGFRMQTEFLVWATNGTLRPWDGQPYLPGVFRVRNLNAGKVHITQKPTELMEQLVQLCPPGGLIADPYGGSATTGVAAVQSGRRFVGAELVPQYHETGLRRLREATGEL